ncbi:hypothetical protein GCM10022403_098960 [Streptomyces coacervatus]|uniref:Phasin domain-containing protein n=1 Tax=Streptomyces coacervatus TaxID=647381 RepID=A0ABP7JR75_9ACTN|nr:hypothetical protein [Streptomyces coacervatus]MDF2263866.1 hypothetical protein [Streptomyces coacervatus]
MRYSAPLTPAQAEQLGKDVGMIVAFAARALNHMHGTNIDRLIQTFTSSNALEVTAARYLKALEGGHTPGEAAGRAGTALVHDWADAVLEAAAAARSTQMPGGSHQADA